MMARYKSVTDQSNNMAKSKGKPNKNYQVAFDTVAAQNQLNEMRSNITPAGIRASTWYFNKMFRRAFQGIHVDTASLQTVRDLVESGHKVVLMPLYKSFGDGFI